MNNFPFKSVLVLALSARIIWCLLGWNTSWIESYNDNITIVYQRVAYLNAFGYGYVQTKGESPAYSQVMNDMDSILHRAPYNKTIDESGLYQFQQYPPGWPLAASALFTITGLPIPWLMQIVGILVDLITLILLVKVCLLFFSRKTVLISSIIYAIYPPVLAITVSMTPDSWMIFFIALLLYLYFFLLPKRRRLTLLLIGIINGIAVLFRPDFLFISLFILTGDFVINKNFRLFFVRSVVLYTITFLTMLPWALYNYQRNHHLLFTSTALGATMVSGFAAYDDPIGLGPSDHDRLQEATAAGIQNPFEYEGNQFFKEQMKEYISEYPLYYCKTIGIRTISFLTPAYLWGLEKDDEVKFSSILNEGDLFEQSKIIISHFTLNILSAIIALLGNIALVILALRNRKNRILVTFITISCCVYISHVFIHMTPTYVIPLVFFQVTALIGYLERIIVRNE